MEKTKITPEFRANCYPDDYEVRFGNLYCKVCDKYVNHVETSVVKNHLKGNKHVELKLLNENKKIHQTFLPRSNIMNNETIRDFILLLSQLSIPFEKVDLMRWWLKKYMTNEGAIPSSQTLRDYHLNFVATKDIDLLKENFKDKKINLIVDGTTDALGRHLVNTIASNDNGIKKIIKVDYVEKENNQTISASLSKAIFDINSIWTNIDCIISDNASKNILAVENIKKTFKNDIVHIRCINHVFELSIQKFINSEIFDCLHTFLSKLQNIFSHSKEKVNAYLDTIVENGERKPKKMPKPVLTRWGSWIETVFYLDEYFIDIEKFIFKQNSENVKSTKLLKDLYLFLSNYYNRLYTLTGIKIISDHAQFILETIFFLERNEPIMFELDNKIREISYFFELFANGNNLQNISQKVYNLLCEYQLQDDSNVLVEKINSIGKASLDICNKYFNLPCYLFVKSNAVFDPLQKSKYSNDIDFYLNANPLLRNEKNIDLLKEFHIYLNSDVNMEEGENTTDFWRRMRNNLPYLSKFALRIMHIPVSQAEIERSFSLYRKILVPSRYNLSTKSIEQLLMLKYNNQ